MHGTEAKKGPINLPGGGNVVTDIKLYIRQDCWSGMRYTGREPAFRLQDTKGGSGQAKRTQFQYRAPAHLSLSGSTSCSILRQGGLRVLSILHESIPSLLENWPLVTSGQSVSRNKFIHI